MRHINIPIFIPHIGCPNNCVFCNQRSISGHADYSRGKVEEEIESALETVDRNSQVQIAFFGGSFTGIDRGEMIGLLSLAKKYIDDGRVRSIRLSTRPDYIDREVLEILSQYGAETIELGIQSVSDKVLAASGRGHSKTDGIRAMKLVKEYGFELVGQMMVGLPASDAESEIETARTICACGADAARIYPTVVFKNTELCEMARTGLYTPLTLNEAVERSTAVKRIFIENGVECIRVGLQSGENLSTDAEIYAGDYHSALGELVDSEIYYDAIKEYIEKNALAQTIKNKNIVIYAPRFETSKVVGHKKRNKLRLQDEYCVKNIKVIEKDGILRYNIILSV